MTGTSETAGEVIDATVNYGSITYLVQFRDGSELQGELRPAPWSTLTVPDDVLERLSEELLGEPVTRWDGPGETHYAGSR